MALTIKRLIVTMQGHLATIGEGLQNDKWYMWDKRVLHREQQKINSNKDDTY